MSFEICITALKGELKKKHKIIKTEELLKINEDERRLQLIHKIQLTVKELMKKIAESQFPVINTVLASWENCIFDGRVKLKEKKRKTKRIDFKRQNSRADFAAIIFLLSKIYKLLITQQMSMRRLYCNNTLNIGNPARLERFKSLEATTFLALYDFSVDFRELYYENLKIFKSQKQIDKGMKEVCYLLNAPTWELRVFTTSKGIVAGPVVFTLTNGQSVDCGKHGGFTCVMIAVLLDYTILKLVPSAMATEISQMSQNVTKNTKRFSVRIPQNVLEIEKMTSSATWVLIVEKDASFQKLINNEASSRLGSCILMTGKGFPDVNSRILVCKFWELLQIPILVLVDADPHGFEIMCVYRFGSLSMSPYSEHLACPAVRWLGVHPSDIRPLLLDTKVLSPNDGKKINSLLKRTYVKENKGLKTQLEILLEGNVKSEIEGLASISINYLMDVYMKNKIQCEEYL